MRSPTIFRSGTWKAKLIPLLSPFCHLSIPILVFRTALGTYIWFCGLRHIQVDWPAKDYTRTTYMHIPPSYVRRDLQFICLNPTQVLGMRVQHPIHLATPLMTYLGQRCFCLLCQQGSTLPWICFRWNKFFSFKVYFFLKGLGIHERTMKSKKSPPFGKMVENLLLPLYFINPLFKNLLSCWRYFSREFWITFLGHRALYSIQTISCESLSFHSNCFQKIKSGWNDKLCFF